MARHTGDPVGFGTADWPSRPRFSRALFCPFCRERGGGGFGIDAADKDVNQRVQPVSQDGAAGAETEILGNRLLSISDKKDPCGALEGHCGYFDGLGGRNLNAPPARPCSSPGTPGPPIHWVSSWMYPSISVHRPCGPHHLLYWCSTGL